MRPNKDLIEERFKESIDIWVSDACPTGDFLLAVLSNDLKEAIARGDDAAIDNLPHIVAYLYNDCPAHCWGSPAEVNAWRGTSPPHAPETCIDSGGDAGPTKEDR